MNRVDLPLTDVLRERHSCRAFRPDPVPDDVLDQLFGLAQLTPSSCNSQPWYTYLTKGAATARLSRALHDHVTTNDEPAPDIDIDPEFSGVFLDRKRACGMALYASVGIERSDYPAREAQMRRNFSFFDAPHAVVFTSDVSLGDNGLLDSGGYMATVSLLAQGLGLGTVLQGAIARYAPAVRDFFQIPDNEVVIGAMSLGYEDTDHPINQFRTERAAVPDVLRTVTE